MNKNSENDQLVILRDCFFVPPTLDLKKSQKSKSNKKKSGLIMKPHPDLNTIKHAKFKKDRYKSVIGVGLTRHSLDMPKNDKLKKG